jgi:colicin import membrane protein
MKETTPYSIPKEPGRWRAIILAALVHALLFGFFWIGIRWKNEQPVAVEAEVWDMQAKQAAPRPDPTPEPAIKPEPQPTIKEEPKQPEPKPQQIEEKPVPKPDIVLEQEKKRKAEELKKRQQEEEQARQKELAERRRIEEEKLKKAKAEQDRIDQEQLKKAQAEKKRKEEERKRKQEAEELARLEALRAENLKRMMGNAGTGGTGDAPKSQGSNRADAAYIDRIASKIKSNIAFIVPNDLLGNPPVEFEVRLLPDGSVAGIRKLKSSGVPGFDEAVARAIERSQPYPKDSSGAVPSSFIGIHKPKDQ